MHIEDFRNYCLSKVAVEESLPFGPDTLVFKVLNKVFAITSLTRPSFTVNLKCDPDRSTELRESFPEIIPGFHMNKKHWNTVDFEGSLRPSFLQELIDHSYDCVVKGFSKKQKATLLDWSR
jgi:predicted DNA-binding protein (MmcQ/YjbR family)